MELAVVVAVVAIVLGFVALYLAAVHDSDWWLLIGTSLVVGGLVAAIGPAT